MTLIILSAPTIPVEYTVTQTRTRPLRYKVQYHNETGVPLYVNVTNTDSVGGVFSVTMELSEGKPVIGGVEFERREETTVYLFIDAGDSAKFESPEEWMPLESRYAFFYTVTPPITQENCNVTKIEYKSLISTIL